jgi:uncharacterized repeat protein (TIGR04138 family)
VSEDVAGNHAPDGEVINEDLPCDECGYNLRGLREGHRCPECGAPIHVWPEGSVDAETSAQFRQIGESLGVSEHAVWFVFDAVNFTLERAQVAHGRRGHVSAELLMWGVRDYALDYFGTPQEAKRRLARIQLLRSEDVGRVVMALVKEGIFEASAEDRPEDFENLFTVDTLFVGPK